MSSASLDRFLAVLVVLLATTGLVSLRTGDPGGAGCSSPMASWPGCSSSPSCSRSAGACRVQSAGAAGGGSRSGSSITFGAAAALAAGYLWVALGEIVWLDVAGLMRWTLLTVHAWIGLVLVPLVVIHLLPRRWRLLRPASGSIDQGRRSRLLTRRSAARRWRPACRGGRSSCGGRRGRAGPRRAAPLHRLALAAGRRHPAADHVLRRARAIDRRCPLAPAGRRSLAFAPRRAARPGRDHPHGRPRLHLGLGARDGLAGRAAASRSSRPRASRSTRDVVVRSATGWATVVPPGEAADCLLAWGCAEADLPAGNGAPLRLVAPGHRGSTG